MEALLHRHDLALARQVFRTVMSSNYNADHLLVRAGPDGIELIATDLEVDVRFRVEAHEGKPLGPCAFIVDSQGLEDASRSPGEIVTLTGKPEPEGVVENLESIRFEPTGEFVSQDWQPLRQRLVNAMRAVCPAPARYALNRLCLHRGGVVATDGRQLFAGNSLQFPLPEGAEVLVAPPKPLMTTAFRKIKEVEVAQDDEAVYFRFGYTWTVRIHKLNGSFPEWRSVIPPEPEVRTRLHLNDAAARLLLDRLPKTKEQALDDEAVTLELNGRAIIRAGGNGEGLVIPDTEVKGEPVSIEFNAYFMREALRMGFRQFRFHGPSAPIIAEQDTDIYLFMPITDVQEEERPDPEQPNPQQSNPEEPETQETEPSTEDPSPKQKENPMPDSSNASDNGTPNGNGAGNGTQPADLDAILAEVESIRTSLRDLARRTGAVHAAAKSYAGDLKKREKAVQQTCRAPATPEAGRVN